MSNLITTANAVIVSTQNRVATFRTERGAISAEFGVVIMVAVALALSIFALLRGGMFDGALQRLISSILTNAAFLVDHGVEA